MTTLADVAAPARARLLTRPLMVRFVSVIGTATSFYLLLSAVPLYARSAGASTGLAGLTTTALTLSSVAAYPVTPRLMARYGSRAVLAGGLLALGLPALARVRLRGVQRAVEPRLRRRHGPGRGRVRGARPARRVPGRVRAGRRRAGRRGPARPARRRGQGTRPGRSD